jgi:hypothetical protein
MQEQIGWSEDTFYIRDINGQPCFIMKGKAMSFSQRKSESLIPGEWTERIDLILCL